MFFIICISISQKCTVVLQNFYNFYRLQKFTSSKNRIIFELSNFQVEISRHSVLSKISKDNRNINFQGTSGNDSNESTTRTHANITNSLSGPNPNNADPNESRSLDAGGAKFVKCTRLKTFCLRFP